jgi:hypothetical protein
MESIVTLTNAPHGFGGKAGHLSALLARGSEVPVGFVIAPDVPQASISISATIPSLAVVMAVSTVGLYSTTKVERRPSRSPEPRVEAQGSR